ncbi:MAG TPA: hypothetical protein VG105_18445 [Paraburkholderia sp.]|jgi:hypothetical protein|nr:hypothetical protein [Paraburkholderia sp.]
MRRLLVVLTLAGGLTGCVVAPPYGYGYAPAYGYAPGYYAPSYYAAPTIGIGIGGYYGWHGH